MPVHWMWNMCEDAYGIAGALRDLCGESCMPGVPWNLIAQLSWNLSAQACFPCAARPCQSIPALAMYLWLQSFLLALHDPL